MQTLNVRLDPVRVRVLNCAIDLCILRENHRQNSYSQQPSSTAFSANLALNRRSLELTILTKINV